MTLLATDPRRCSVYRWFAAGGQLLYVGASVDPERRWDQIRTAETWTRFASRREIEWHDTCALALTAEMEAIRTEAPLLNLFGLTKGIRAFTDHWRELQLPDGEVVPMLRTPGLSRWLVGDDEILAHLEQVEIKHAGCGSGGIGYCHRSTCPERWRRYAVVRPTE